MKIGIDVGGSHIGVGLVEGENLLTKLDHYYSQEEKENIENAIINIISNLTYKLLTENNFDIENIESFSTNLETIPRGGGEGLVIYANRKDGTSYRFSPIYVRPSKYVDTELIKPLNKALKRKPLMINIRFPH